MQANEFRALALARLGELMRSNLIMDPCGLFESAAFTTAVFDYLSPVADPSGFTEHMVSARSPAAVPTLQSDAPMHECRAWLSGAQSSLAHARSAAEKPTSHQVTSP